MQKWVQKYPKLLDSALKVGAKKKTIWSQHLTKTEWNIVFRNIYLKYMSIINIFFKFEEIDFIFKYEKKKIILKNNGGGGEMYLSENICSISHEICERMVFLNLKVSEP